MDPIVSTTPTPAAPVASSKPDAIMIPFGFDPGGKAPDKQTRILDYLDATMGVPRAFINDARFDVEEDGMHWSFCYPNPHDTYLHPVGHPSEKKPRYDWSEVQPNGVKFGTLKADAWKAGPNGERQKPGGGDYPAFNPIAARGSNRGGPIVQVSAEAAPHGFDAVKLARFGDLARIAARTEEQEAEFQKLDRELFPHGEANATA